MNGTSGACVSRIVVATACDTFSAASRKLATTAFVPSPADKVMGFEAEKPSQPFATQSGAPTMSPATHICVAPVAASVTVIGPGEVAKPPPGIVTDVPVGATRSSVIVPVAVSVLPARSRKHAATVRSVSVATSVHAFDVTYGSYVAEAQVIDSLASAMSAMPLVASLAASVSVTLVLFVGDTPP